MLKKSRSKHSRLCSIHWSYVEVGLSHCL